MKTLSTSRELRAYLGEQPGAMLIHVLPADVFAARRIAGSRNACVYEVAFLSQVGKIAPDKDAPLVLYGAGGGSQDARAAAEKLAAAGYTDLTVFEGGLQAWEEAGEAFEAFHDLPAAPTLDGAFQVNPADSVVRWTGRNLFNHHSGTLRLASGNFEFDQGRLVGGRVVLDMTTMACEDITDPATNAVLIRHLRDADFFLVDKFPATELVVRAAESIAGSTEGTPNWQVRADLTLRGVTRSLEFPVLLAAASADRLTAQAQLDLDRTAFGSIYGSGRFFRFLGQHVVNDHVHLHVKLHANRLAG
jgi:polyisoprenoid-binding protein YceI